MKIPQKTKTLSLLLKAVVFLAAALGVTLSAIASRTTFMGGGRVFMFFTIQSNIAIGLICLAGGVLLLGDRQPGRAWGVVKFVGSVSITLTGAVFTFILAPTFRGGAWNAQNVLTHLMVPLAAIADFFVTGPYCDLRKRDVGYVILPPLAYAVYAGVGYVAGWEFAEGIRYPYFFLNWGSPAGAFGFTKGLPFMGCAWWILALLLLLLAVGYGYLGIVSAMKKRK